MADSKEVIEFHLGFGDGDGEAGFEVDAIADCPHVHGVSVPTSIAALDGLACASCDTKDEPWICLGCANVGCSRYVNGHAAQHSSEQAATASACSLALSPADMSIWCFGCNAYVDVFRVPELHAAFTHVYRLKFGSDPSLPSGKATSEPTAAAPTAAAPAPGGAAPAPSAAAAAAAAAGGDAAAASAVDATPTAAASGGSTAAPPRTG